MRKIITVLCFVCCVFSLLCNGGGLQAQTTLIGKVLDQKTKAPIPYASVYVENTFTGKATADDGTFSFEIKEGHQGDVIIRAMGYDTKVVKQSEFMPQGLTIYLVSSSFSIEEVEASAKKALTDPIKIVKKAIKRIPDNMASDYTVLDGTYHQAFQDYETDRLLDASQLQVKVGLQGIKTKHKTDSIWHDKPLSDNVFWESFRYNEDALLPQYQIPDYGRDHLQCLLRMDPVRNYGEPTFDFVERLDKDFVDNHYFWLDSIGVYNGENVYCITVFLWNTIRFSKINVTSISYAMIRDQEDYTTIKYKNTYPARLPLMYLPPYNGRAVSIPIGKLMINTNDLAITYFEYINGFGNDRYKFIAEYFKENDKYYPSKIYFANKFRMNPHPDFNMTGSPHQDGLICEMSRRFYSNVVKEHSKTEIDMQCVSNIIEKNTIKCPLSSYVKAHEKTFVNELIPYTKIVEEIQDTFLYADYGKYLHHRFIEFDIKDNTPQITGGNDFFDFYCALGDRTFKWNAYYRWSTTRYLMHYSKYHIHKAGNPGSKYFPMFWHVPMPITSKDEYRYIIKSPKNPNLYDKPDLVKGLFRITPRLK